MEYFIFQNFQYLDVLLFFLEYSMEYSIFQNFQYFGCFAIFLEYSKSIFHKTFQFTMENRILEYSWNIPYSIHLDILLVLGFLWNIPFLAFSYSMEYSMEYSVEYFMEYSILKIENVLRGRKV